MFLKYLRLLVVFVLSKYLQTYLQQLEQLQTGKRFCMYFHSHLFSLLRLKWKKGHVNVYAFLTSSRVELPPLLHSCMNLQLNIEGSCPLSIDLKGEHTHFLSMPMLLKHHAFFHFIECDYPQVAPAITFVLNTSFAYSQTLLNKFLGCYMCPLSPVAAILNVYITQLIIF